MPRARKRSPRADPVEEEIEAMDTNPVQEEMEAMEEDETQPLVFNEALTWRPGKQIPVTELLRRLNSLCEELNSMDQENADRVTLVPKAQELASAQLLGHKDKGVKAYAMLCITEMFRLLAPDAPYKSSQLKEIFTIFSSSIIPALANLSDPYNEQYNAILQSLTTVRSIVLVTDIPGSDTIILNLFTNCFDVVAGGARDGGGEKLPKNVEYHMTNMLDTLVDECSTLPTGVGDIILAQFLRADPKASSTGSKKGEAKQSEILSEISPAYIMARSVCNTQWQKMNRVIGHYFSSVLIDASEVVATNHKAGKSRGKKRTHDESEDESDDGLLTPPAEGDLGEAEKAHRLLRELWRSCPDVIQDIIPQIEAEIEAERPELRVMAVQTLGDMIAGIGAAGPSDPTPLEPAAYPSQSLEENKTDANSQNAILAPNAPHAFSSVYSNAYQCFIDRHKDKSAQVRSAWVTEAGRIILTSGGGKGLDGEQEKVLLAYLSGLLVDIDDRVRLAAVQAIACFDFPAIIEKLGKSGSVTEPASVLCNLADRIKDRKQHVRNAAIELLGRIWGVAAGAITEGRERARELLGAIPSKIFEAMYVNNPEINALIQRVLFDSLLPFSYPPIKAKQTGNGDSQRVNDSQVATSIGLNPDAIRAERILVLVRDLEEKAKTVFFALQQRQANSSKYIEAYLKACEEVHAATGHEKEKEEKKLHTLIDALAKSSADPQTATDHFKKFAKQNDRRSYQLIRFCYDTESDYRKVVNAIRELTKRLEKESSARTAVVGTLLPLVRSASILVYNRSHVPAIVEISRTDEKDLGTAAHEILKEISMKAPEIFKIHVYELCESLKKHKPSLGESADSAVVDTLKACVGFARRSPEGMPKDRDFYKAMVAYATYGSPPKAAKHAVTVIVSSADKKDMYIREIQKGCIRKFEYGKEGFLSKLASMSQLKLLANSECEDEAEAITELAIGQVLGRVRTVATATDPEWTDEIDEDLSAKLWALRILVNGLRGFHPGPEFENPEAAIKEVADEVYKLLNTLIKKEGELSKTSSTPKHHRAHLRLAAAKHLLKLSCNRKLDPLLTPNDFNRLSYIVQDPIPEVRAGFAKTLNKYLGSGALPNRFYALVFLYAFEPNKETLQAITTWLKSRAAMSAKLKDNAMETAFARFLSLLAHHQDFTAEPDDLRDFVEYVMFFLKNAATQENLPMIYHLAQRIKSVQDGIDPEKSDNLYILSDIAEAVIRQFQEVQGWSLQLISARAPLPSVLFQKLPSHAAAQEIAEKKYIPDELAEDLEELVKSSMKKKAKTNKRKSEATSTQAAKKYKPSTNGTAKILPVRKAPKATNTPKKTIDDQSPSSERRKSSRVSNARSYAENDDSEDDEELGKWQEGTDAVEKASSPTPPTSDPPSASVHAKEKQPLPRKEKVTNPSPARVHEKKAAKPAPTPVRKEKAVAKATPQKSSSQARDQRAAKATRAKKDKERDIMDVPSDSD